VIPVHRLTHPEAPLWLNPDLVQQIEKTPDTVILLTNGTRLVVNEEPEQILELVRVWRATVVALAAEPGLFEQAPTRLKSVTPLPIT
jgi:flagellar protein FlbD